MQLRELRVPVLMLDGTSMELSAEEVLQRKYDIHSLAMGCPMQRMALLRHLCVWEADGIPDVGIDEYMQTPITKGKTVPLPMGLTIVERSTGNTVLADAKVPDQPMTASDALMALLAVHLCLGYRNIPGASKSYMPYTMYYAPIGDSLGATIDMVVDALDNSDMQWRELFTYQPHDYQLVIDDHEMVSHVRYEPVQRESQAPYYDPMHAVFATDRKPRNKEKFFEGYDRLSVNIKSSDSGVHPDVLSWKFVDGMLPTQAFKESCLLGKLIDSDELRGWEAACRLTGEKGSTAGVLSQRVQFPRGFKLSSSYRDVFDDLKKLTNSVEFFIRCLNSDTVSVTKNMEVRSEMERALVDHLRRGSSMADIKHDLATRLRDVASEAWLSANITSYGQMLRLRGLWSKAIAPKLLEWSAPDRKPTTRKRLVVSGPFDNLDDLDVRPSRLRKEMPQEYKKREYTGSVVNSAIEALPDGERKLKHEPLANALGIWSVHYRRLGRNPHVNDGPHLLEELSLKCSESQFRALLRVPLMPVEEAIDTIVRIVSSTDTVEANYNRLQRDLALFNQYTRADWMRRIVFTRPDNKE